MESSNQALKLILMCIMGLAMAHVCRAKQSHDSHQDYLDIHNAARLEVGLGPMRWDDKVAAYAQNYANKRRRDCQLRHSGGPYGENIFWGSSPVFTARDAVKDWVSEKQYYNYESNTCEDGQVCGHYTQVVWRDSVGLGCARVICNKNGGVFITCNYNPPGNYVGERPY